MCDTSINGHLVLCFLVSRGLLKRLMSSKGAWPVKNHSTNPFQMPPEPLLKAYEISFAQCLGQKRFSGVRTSGRPTPFMLNCTSVLYFMFSFPSQPFNEPIIWTSNTKASWLRQQVSLYIFWAAQNIKVATKMFCPTTAWILSIMPFAMSVWQQAWQEENWSYVIAFLHEDFRPRALF